MINRAKLIAGTKKESELAVIIGMKPANFSKQKTKTGHKLLKKIVDWAVGQNANLHWLYTGKGDQYAREGPQQLQVEERISPYGLDLEHTELVQRFEQKELARNINSILVEIEQMNPEALKEVETYLKGMHSGIEISYTKEKQNRSGGKVQPDSTNETKTGTDDK